MVFDHIVQKAIAFAIEGKVRAAVHTAKPEDINYVYVDMKKRFIDGRVVLEITKS
jgi:propanol-preferring alcohol dehydrogenase